MVMLYTICMLPGLLNRILEFSGYKLYPLFVAQAVCAPLTGAADAVVFGFNARLRDTLCCRKARTGTSRSGSDHVRFFFFNCPVGFVPAFGLCGFSVVVGAGGD